MFAPAASEPRQTSTHPAPATSGSATARLWSVRCPLGWVVATLALCLLTGIAAAQPLEVEVERDGGALEVTFQLLEPLPDSFVAALPSGAQVRVIYPVRVRAVRRLLWNRKVWQGEVTSSVTFDPVTGRYRCELVLDRVIVASRESSSPDEARTWLTAPPAVRLSLPLTRRDPDLVVRVRAVFASSTKWLLFPAVEGSEWFEVTVESGS